MTIEEKAIRYDEVKNKLSRFIAQGVDPLITRADVQDFFPELAESKDEKIRKEIVRFIQMEVEDEIVGNKWLAWLGKQCEQNSTNNVEPKFKVGDWVIFNEHHNSVYQVEKIQGLRYYLRHYLGGTLSVHFDNELIRLWNISDARDGDVLALDWKKEWEWQKIVIFKSLSKDGVEGYGNTFKNNKLAFKEDVPFYSKTWTKYLHPATKEQRDLLFQKMQENGYMWDAENKAVTKIEQKPADSYCQENCNGFQETGKCFADGECKTKREAEQNSTWSEEDERMFDYALDMIEWYSGKNEDKSRLVSNWLKSLKGRVQKEE